MYVLYYNTRGESAITLFAVQPKTRYFLSFFFYVALKIHNRWKRASARARTVKKIEENNIILLFDVRAAAAAAVIILYFITL